VTNLLVEIHAIQNFAPSSLNRDDNGNPKTALFGGTRRARISSQCQKRAIRQSPVFKEVLSDFDLGIKTQFLPRIVCEKLVSRGMDESLARLSATVVSQIATRDKKPAEELETSLPVTPQLIFFSEQDVENLAGVIETVFAFRDNDPAIIGPLLGVEPQNKKAKVNKEFVAEVLDQVAFRDVSPDIALFGRMTTSEAVENVHSALQVAHAISTHGIVQEYDFFTAVDDFVGDRAAFIGEDVFNSSCYYRYLAVDFGTLEANLGGGIPVAIQTIRALVKALVFATPPGKRNSFSANQLPELLLIEVRPRNRPASYANAFETPVPNNAPGGILDQSVAKLLEFQKRTTAQFALPSAGRYLFTGEARAEKTEFDGTIVTTLPTLLEQLGTGLARLAEQD